MSPPNRKRTDFIGQPSSSLLDVGKPQWTIRRRVVFGTLGFCGIAITYLIGWAPSDPLRETIASSLVLLAASVVTGYVFGATWDDNNYRNTVLKNNYIATAADRRVLEGETPDDFAG